MARSSPWSPSAAAYKTIGVPVYSSALFNFIPRIAVEFYEATRTNDYVITGCVGNTAYDVE